jgi:hypothetical protein
VQLAGEPGEERGLAAPRATKQEDGLAFFSVDAIEQLIELWAIEPLVRRRERLGQGQKRP